MITFDQLDKYVYDGDSYSRNVLIAKRYELFKSMRHWVTIEQAIEAWKTQEFFI